MENSGGSLGGRALRIMRVESRSVLSIPQSKVTSSDKTLTENPGDWLQIFHPGQKNK